MKIENSNRKKQIHFVANSLYKINANNYKINVVKIEKMYFTKNIFTLRNKYNLDVDVVQDINCRKQRQSIEANISFLIYRNLIYKIIQVITKSRKKN